MSWEAFRLTSKSPSELYDVLGPEGVDNLLRQCLTACWNALPAGERAMAAWRRLVDEVFERNMRVWSRIKKPNPVHFFENLRPEPADGHLRQAMVMCWMMLPRAGGRDFSDTKKIIRQIYERNLAAWEQDNRTFTAAPAKSKPSSAKAKAKSSRSRSKPRRKTSRK
jgi:hypothetical protein